MKYVIGVDFGGGASKAILLNEHGKVVATNKSEYKTICFDGGGREQCPEDWFNATIENIQGLLNKSNVNSNDIKCLCFDAATHTAVLMDENFNVIKNSVYWTDIRSVKQKKFLQDNFGEDIFNKFYHSVDTIWTLPQLLWVKENEPKLWDRVKKITFSKDYVRGRFTGDFVTDYIEAEGSMFFDFDKRVWDKKYLDILGIDESYLPKIVNPLDFVGGIKKEVAISCGLKEGTPVICGSTDTAMEVFASGAIKKGQTTIKLATAGRICIITDKLIRDKNLVSYSHVIDGLYYPGTATKSCASSIRWFRDNFGGSYEEYDELTKNVPIGSDGLIFNPYLSGELTPYGNPNLKGSFTGLTFMHTKGHFVKSIMEGVAFSLKDCKKYLNNLGINFDSAFIIGGGAKSKQWKQIVSDCLNVKLILTENNDSSFGSAMLAGIYVNMFKDYNDAVIKCQNIISEIVPNTDNAKIYDKIFEKYKKTGEFLVKLSNEE